MNKVILMGRLTRDPEIRTTVSNVSVANFTLAVNRRFRRENEQEADFIPIVAWSRLADFAKSYLKKGRQIVVIGRLQLRTWDDESNRRHYMTEVVAEEIYFAEPKPKDMAADGEIDTKANNSVSHINDDDLLESELEGFYEQSIDTPMHSGLDENPEDDLPF